jgi:hypothetical protein
LRLDAGVPPDTPGDAETNEEKMDARSTGARWEYNVVKLGPSSSLSSREVLNELGLEGWELVTFQPTGERAYPGEGTYFLKRPLFSG